MEMQYYDSQRDFGEVYRLFVEPNTNELIIFKPDHNDMTSFRKWFEDALVRYINDFMVFYQGKEFVGFAYSYDFSALDGHCLFTIAVKRAYRNSGSGALICARFLQYLFKNYPLRKVYAHVYEYNKDCISCMYDSGIKAECTFKEYHYHNGVYNDMIVFAIERSIFNERLIRFCERR